MRIKVGSDFSGVGAFDQALNRLGVSYETVFACDNDKFARKSYTANYGEPAYFPEDVYDRLVPDSPLDIYMTSPPCQAFSIAGKRLGKEDERGVLFFNSLEFILKNNPRFFIFENVKGLLSHDKADKKHKIGRTFTEWVTLLGGKSVNGVSVENPAEGAVPYHLYWKVLNTKKCSNIPQNRERVFLVGIRDDVDNTFQWPFEQPLTKRLADVLEDDADVKYSLSDTAVATLLKQSEGVDMSENIDGIRKEGSIHPSGKGMNGNVYSVYGVAPTLSTNKGEGIKVLFDSGKGRKLQNRSVAPPLRANTLNTSCLQVVIQKTRGDCTTFKTDGTTGTLQAGGRSPHDKVPNIFDGYSIRRLTPAECFRLMGFPDSFVNNARAAGVSDTQLYRQAGNSIDCVLLSLIIAQLPIYKNDILGGI